MGKWQEKVGEKGNRAIIGHSFFKTVEYNLLLEKVMKYNG